MIYLRLTVILHHCYIIIVGSFGIWILVLFNVYFEMWQHCKSKTKSLKTGFRTSQTNSMNILKSLVLWYFVDIALNQRKLPVYLTSWQILSWSWSQHFRTILHFDKGNTMIFCEYQPKPPNLRNYMFNWCLQTVCKEVVCWGSSTHATYINSFYWVTVSPRHTLLWITINLCCHESVPFFPLSLSTY